MDWTALFKALQTDFVGRVKVGSANLIYCEENHHSELTIVSSEKLKQLHEFCWQMAEKYKKTASVREVFLRNLKGKLAEEAFAARLGNLVTPVDYGIRTYGDEKVDFTLVNDSGIGIQVKARCGSIEAVQWKITSDEIKKNKVLVCILIQEEVTLNQEKYHLISAGFLPTELIEINNKTEFFLKINELLYFGGLRNYLEQLSSKNQVPFALDRQKELNKDRCKPLNDFLPEDKPKDTRLLREKAEASLLRIYLHSPEHRDLIVKNLKEKELEFSLSSHRRLWRMILDFQEACVSKNLEVDLLLWMDYLQTEVPDEMKQVTHVLELDELTRLDLIRPALVIQAAALQLQYVYCEARCKHLRKMFETARSSLAQDQTTGSMNQEKLEELEYLNRFQMTLENEMRYCNELKRQIAQAYKFND